MEPPIIEATGLTRHYTVYSRAGRFRRQKSTVEALNDLTLMVQPGESVGYIGANGAGKSTTIKMLTGILLPTRGTARVCGYDPVPQRRQLAGEIGVVFGQRSQLWWDLPLHESFRLQAALHRLPTAMERERTESLVESLDLGSFLATPVRQLSLGQRMRGEVAVALLHAPRLVILDEPTIGLDMISKESLRVFLDAERRTRGTTLLLTTHDMSDIERLCERVVIVDHGAVLFDGSLASLQRGAHLGMRPTKQIAIDFDRAPAAADLDAMEWPPSCRVSEVELSGQRVTLSFETASTNAAEVLAAAATLAPVRDLATQETPIEDIVREFYTRGRPGAS
ncbi:ATP-binding cassette domain-containing protein [Micrococcales bacterium 31B]|nr:ATP-binding cassette domain-containing protein [Micrococcales bacterium 31B]